MLDRMLETDFMRMQVDSAVRIGTGSAVFEVALDGAAYVAKLTADLVMAPRKQLYLNEMVSFG